MLAASACADERERAPLLQDCTEVRCRVAPIVGQPIGGSGVEPVDPGGPEETDTLSGTVDVLVTPDLETIEPLPEGAAVDVTALDPDGEEVTDRATRDSGFELEGLADVREQFVGVIASPDAFDLMTTLQPVANQPNTGALLHAMARSVLADIQDSGGLQGGFVFEPTRGHAFVVFVESASNLRPVSGVSVVSSSAQTIAYSVSTSYSNVLEETDARGTVLFVNMPGSSYPGRQHEIIVALDAQETTFQLPVVTDGVTLLAVPVSG